MTTRPGKPGKPLAYVLALGLFAAAPSPASCEDNHPGASRLVAIASGEFTMGQENGPADAPAHRVQIDGFFIEETEVTNARYFEFCRATGHRLPEFWGMREYRSGRDFPHHPVVGVSFSDAQAYAEWAGRRLPTEAEWEYAARGGLESKRWPNGDELEDDQAVFGGRGIRPVATFEPNGYGLYDMSGNVVEWTSDRYGSSTYLQPDRDNPTGPEEGKFKVIRGGGWHSGKSCTRVYHRNALPPQWVDFAVGFRCVTSTDPKKPNSTP